MLSGSLSLRLPLLLTLLLSSGVEHCVPGDTIHTADNGRFKLFNTDDSGQIKTANCELRILSCGVSFTGMPSEQCL